MKRYFDSGHGPRDPKLGGSEESLSKRARNRARIAASQNGRPAVSNDPRLGPKNTTRHLKKIRDENAKTSPRWYMPPGAFD